MIRSIVSITTFVSVIDFIMPLWLLILTTSPISKGSTIHISNPATKLEKTPLNTNANAVLTAPVIIAVYSAGRVVKEGNPLIIRYNKIKIEVILKANIILFFLAIGILPRRLNRIERRLLKRYSNKAINTTIMNARMLFSKRGSILHHPRSLILFLEDFFGILPSLYRFYLGIK